MIVIILELAIVAAIALLAIAVFSASERRPQHRAHF
jgi:hypothetical protein